MSWDSPLSELAEVVVSCAQIDNPTDGAINVENLCIETPIELTIVTSAEETVSLGVAPPRQARQTSIMPVIHRIRLTLEVLP
jgi:hypothetical protein